MWPVSRTGWDALLDALLEDVDALSAKTGERLRGEFAAFRTIPVEALERSLRSQLVRLLSAARAGHDRVSDAEVAELAEIGESRARQGVGCCASLSRRPPIVTPITSHPRFSAHRREPCEPRWQPPAA